MLAARPTAAHLMTRFDPKAIFIAMLLSLALDVVGAVLLHSVFGPSLSEDMTPEQLKAAVEAMQQGTGFLLASLLYGTATTVFGGYVAARLARAYPYFNALAIGVLGIVLGLMLASDSPGWYDALAYLVSVPAALLGGHLHQLQRKP
jgi:MFS family permease